MCVRSFDATSSIFAPEPVQGVGQFFHTLEGRTEFEVEPIEQRGQLGLVSIEFAIEAGHGDTVMPGQWPPRR